MQKILELQDISLNRNKQRVLESVSMTVMQGEIFGVVGPSGSGKSSLLRTLNRLSDIDKGTILLNGKDITEYPVLELRQKVGMVFQRPVPFEGTILDNVRYGPLQKEEVLSEQEVLACLHKAALGEDLLYKNASQLSGGQEQRLAIARVLANKPEIILLDEPTSALDPIATRQVEETLFTLSKNEGLTLVWVSHSIGQMERMADRVAFLEDGQLRAVGKLEELLNPDTGDGRLIDFVAGRDNQK